jgi:hypothetical protein
MTFLISHVISLEGDIGPRRSLGPIFPEVCVASPIGSGNIHLSAFNIRYMHSVSVVILIIMYIYVI